MTAVTTPTGTPPSRRARDVGDREQARPVQGGDGQHETRVRADEQADEVRDDEADEPDQPGDRDARGGHERREAEQDRPLAPDVDAEVGGGLLAQEEAVERPRPEEDQDAAPDDERPGDREPRPRRAVEPAEQVREDLAEARCPDRYIAIARPAASSEPTA